MLSLLRSLIFNGAFLTLGGFVTTTDLFAGTEPSPAEFESPTASTDKSPAAQDSPPAQPLKFGFFVDTYYSAILPHPPAKIDQQYITQVARDREFNINLAHIEAVHEGKRTRGRLALQFGTSVLANYQNEPDATAAKYSNRLSTQNIQEAYVGILLFKGLWLDTGIFFSNIGFEDWISINNYNYTRALNAEFTPYYSAGAKLTYELSKRLRFQLHALNGWQAITPPNQDLGFGGRINFLLLPNLRLMHNSYVGNVAPASQPSQLRLYSNFILDYQAFQKWHFAYVMGNGAQKNPSIDSYRHWSTYVFYIRYFIADAWRTALRFETFLDRQQVMVPTGTSNGFMVFAATINLDYEPEEHFLLRAEFRQFLSKDSIYVYSGGPLPMQNILSFSAAVRY